MAEPRRNRMIQPWPPSTKSTASPIPSRQPPVARGSPSRWAWTGAAGPLRRVRPAHPEENPAGQRTPGTAGNSPDRNQPAAQSDGRPPRKPRRQRLRTKGPLPGHGPVPSPCNSTEISTDQSCRKYCEGRSRPSVGPRHHGHPPLTPADANRPGPCQVPHRRRNCDLGKGTELNAV